MDRLNPVHVNARVELSSSVESSTDIVDSGIQSTHRSVLRPDVRYYLGVVGFMCCSAIVIAVASFLALSIG